MINLFHIPTYNIDTSRFSNLLHDKIVRKFEENFADYVGAKYAVSFNSATSAIFLYFKNKELQVKIPSILPPVVANALFTTGQTVTFKDDINWVGNSYVLYKFQNGMKIIDSAHEVRKGQFLDQDVNDYDIMIFSFYPTKIISSCDGGMIVSNDKDIIDWLRLLSFNGIRLGGNSWEKKPETIGYKMYMNSIQAYMANESFKNIYYKKAVLSEVRYRYNDAFGLANTSEHLYRIHVKDNQQFIKDAAAAGIGCGIHYHALHKQFLYNTDIFAELPLSDIEEKTTVSLPYHEKLTLSDIKKVIEFVKKYGNKDS